MNPLITKKNIALLSILALAWLLGSPIFHKIILAAFVIFLAGGAVVSMILFPREGDSLPVPPELNIYYLAAAVSPAIVLLVSSFLRLIHHYSFPFVMSSLVVIVLIALYQNRDFRNFIIMMTPSDPVFLISAAGTVILWLLFSAQEYPYLHGSAVYLTQGFDLFLDKDPSVWPYFGEKYAMPMIYATHSIGAIFALFSSGDHIEFYRNGLYLLNILLAPVVPAGAYLYFRRFLPGWAALTAALVFCGAILDWKIWSIRGETLGWISGFAFLMTLNGLLSLAQTRQTSNSGRRLSIVLALLFGGLVLTHGVVAMVVTFSTLGLVLYSLVSPSIGSRDYRFYLRNGAVFIGCLLVLGFVYFYSFSHGFTSHGTGFTFDQPPRAGEEDAALIFEKAIVRTNDFDVPHVRSSPPLVKTAMVAQMTAFLPVASWYRANIASIPVKHFPLKAENNVQAISRAEKLAYVALLIASCLVFLLRFLRKSCAPYDALFWSSVTVYVMLILFSIYLNYSSVSTFPLAATRRSYVYGKFFFLMAITLAFAVLVSSPLRALGNGMTMLRKPPLDKFPPLVERVIVAAAIALWIGHSISYWAGREPGYSSLWHRIKARIEPKLSIMVPGIAAPTGVGPGGPSRQDDNLFEAVAFIRDHTSPGEWVFCNILSDNQFWFLSNGRYSLLEGSAMYQVYSLQKRAALRINRYADFALRADQHLVADEHFRYVLLYRRCRCDSSPCFGFNVLPTSERAFALNPAYVRVFENTDFAVYQRVEAAGSFASLGPERDSFPDCYDDSIPRYLAAPSDGIQFARAGLPVFVADVKGLSIPETQGRWSNDDEVRIRFRLPLPERFELIVKADAFGPNRGKPVWVSAGSVRKCFIINEDGKTYHLVFDQPGAVDTITFQIPRPTRPIDLDPNNKDDRRMGLGFSWLKIMDNRIHQLGR